VRSRALIVGCVLFRVSFVPVTGFPVQDAHAVTLVQTATGTAEASASVSAVFGATPTQGNLLIAIAGNDDVDTPSTPSGWSVAINEAANNPGQVIFYKVAGASESTTVTVSGYSSNPDLGLHLYEYRGIARTSPLDRTASDAGTSGDPLSSGTTPTTSTRRELLIAAFVIAKDTTFSGWTNSFAERVEFETAGTLAFGGADRIVSATGAYSTIVTPGQTGPWRGQIVTFKAKRRVMIIQ
jgi:hypothetical protein